MKIVLMTTFENPWGLEMIRSLLEGKMKLIAVICSHDQNLYQKEQEIFQERTRGYYTIPRLSEVAKHHLLPFYFVAGHNDFMSEKVLMRLKPDLLVLGGADIIRPNILAIPARGTLNIHPGLLPEYRGCSAVEWAIYNDDPVGATCHFVTPEIDSGPIVCREILPIRHGEPYESIRARMFRHGADVLLKGIHLLKGDFKGLPVLPGTGKYYNVMNEETLAVVKEKLRKLEYKQYEK